MPTPRLQRWGRTSGPLSAALLLHAALLGAAALATFGVLPPRDEELGTIALALTPHRPPESRPEPAPRFTELETRVSAALDDDLRTVELDALELVSARTTPPAAPEPELRAVPPPQVALDLTPPDFTSLDFGAFGGAGSSATGDAGAVGGGLGAVASAGGGGRAPGSPGGGEGSQGIGPGAGELARAGEAAAPAPVASVRDPKAIEKPAPAYPKIARRRGEEGSVLCRLHLTATGDVEQVDVVESSGFGTLDEAARATLARWRFEPKLVDGRAVATTWLHKVTFQLE